MANNIKWYNSQLHNHSRHSDGKDTIPDMITKLTDRGAEVLALTDHNTAAGNTEFLQVCKERGLIGIRGNEVSTYYGHVVGLEVEDYIDWRYFYTNNPEEIFDEIHKRGGLCGYAHPIRIGYPLVPGCSWLFTINDYSKIDYFEILNTGDYIRSRNDMVIDYWIKKLREGYLHLGATSGLDFHSRPYHGHEYVTYLALDPNSIDKEKAAVESIKNQHMIVCKDGLINIWAEDSFGNSYIPGDAIHDNKVTMHIDIPESYGDDDFIIVVNNQNNETIHNSRLISINTDVFAVIRVYSKKYDFDHLLAVSNPFHFIKG